MRSVGRALARIADAEPDLVIVLPAHKNPGGPRGRAARP